MARDLTANGRDRSGPDDHARGFGEVVDPLRYDSLTNYPMEVGALLAEMMPASARVLDVGCGTGSITLRANQGTQNEVVALEPDGVRAAIARSRGIDVHNRFLDESFLTTQDPFDVVMMSDVLEHVATPAQFLQLAISALKPNGLILASVPNVAHWSVRIHLLRGRFDYAPTGIMDATHLRWFTQSSIRSLFEACELRISEIRHTAGVDLPVYVSSTLRRIPRRWRDPGIRFLTRRLPLAFGCQHVVKAQWLG